jgi:hypothetical protein
MATWSLKMPTKSMIVSHHHPSGMAFKLHQSPIGNKSEHKTPNPNTNSSKLCPSINTKVFDLAQNAMSKVHN